MTTPTTQREADNFAWSHELQKRLMVADDQGDDELHNLLGEVACCLATLTGRPDTALTRQAAPEAPALPKRWEDRIATAHPTSEPQYWPIDLKAKYMLAELTEWRASTGAAPEAPATEHQACMCYHGEYCPTCAKPAGTTASEQEKFCDGHCVWTDHHPDCTLLEPESPADMLNPCTSNDVVPNKTGNLNINEPAATTASANFQKFDLTDYSTPVTYSNRTDSTACRGTEPKMYPLPPAQQTERMQPSREAAPLDGWNVYFPTNAPGSIVVSKTGEGIVTLRSDAPTPTETVLYRYFAALACAPLPAQDAPLSNAEFLAKRLGRVAKLAGVTMPSGTYEQIAEVAGTILGDIARVLESKGAQAVDVARDADLPDLLSTIMWLYRRTPAAFGCLPSVEKAIKRLGQITGIDVSDSLNERALMIRTNTTGGSEE